MTDFEQEERRVLVIDDDASLRRVIEYTLDQAGYEVQVAADGSEGLQAFSRFEPPVVITDIQMPGPSGYEVLREVKEARPETAVIVITAFGSVEKAVTAMKEGAFDYLTKPFSRDELRLTVDRAFSFLGLQAENARLRSALEAREEFGRLVGTSDAMQEVFDLVRRVAPSEATVLIEGESGTGKELVARAIHEGSERREEPFVAVNCAAIPPDLLESELFGHVKGAFTGAVRDRAGKFLQADGGTLFLDEVGELPLEMQPKLLRTLQEREIEPVGGTSRRVDVRLVAATNRDLEAAIAEGGFREDLYYRLAVVPLHLPPLRRRPEDIPLLLRHFTAKHDARDVTFEPQAEKMLGSYDWPGNVRELENLVEQVLVLRQGDRIGPADLPAKIRRGRSAAAGGVLNLPPEGYPLEQLEREAIETALARCGGNQTRAAEFLRIPRHTLVYRLEKYGIGRRGEG